MAVAMIRRPVARLASSTSDAVPFFLEQEGCGCDLFQLPLLLSPCRIRRVQSCFFKVHLSLRGIKVSARRTLAIGFREPVQLRQSS